MTESNIVCPLCENRRAFSIRAIGGHLLSHLGPNIPGLANVCIGSWSTRLRVLFETDPTRDYYWVIGTPAFLEICSAFEDEPDVIESLTHELGRIYPQSCVRRIPHRITVNRGMDMGEDLLLERLPERVQDYILDLPTAYQNALININAVNGLFFDLEFKRSLLPQNSPIETTLDSEGLRLRKNENTVHVDFRTTYEEVDGLIRDLLNLEDDEELPEGDQRVHFVGTNHRIYLTPGAQGRKNVSIRLNREVEGIADIFKKEEIVGKSILVLGVQGSGKTTFMRDLGRSCVDKHELGLTIIDSHGEIAGGLDLDEQEAAEGWNIEPLASAKIIKPDNDAEQARMMLNVVTTDGCEACMIDEIVHRESVKAVLEIGYRGGSKIGIIASTHGSLHDLVNDRSRVKLLGDSQLVILGDDRARRLKVENKATLERVSGSVFDVCLEIVGLNHFLIHENVSHAVDSIYREKAYKARQVKIDAINGFRTEDTLTIQPPQRSKL